MSGLPSDPLSEPPPGWNAKVKDQGQQRGPSQTSRSHWPREDIPGKGTRPRSQGNLYPKDTILYSTPLFNLEARLSPRPQTPFYNPLLTPPSLPGRQRKMQNVGGGGLVYSGPAGPHAEPWGRGCEQLTWYEHPAPLLPALLCGHHTDRLCHSPIGLLKPLDVRHPPCITHQLQGKDISQ